MKKFALFLSATAIAVGASQARTLSPDEALSRLDEASASTQGMRAPKFNGAKKLVKTATFNNLPTYYVFSTPSQTIFVGADDVAQPLLGYIDNPDFNEAGMPPAMKWWLEEYSRQIEYATARQAKAAPVRQKVQSKLSQAPMKATRSAISPLCATTWDQGAPYNNLMPTKSGQRTYTGCVATAMAQVMKYHNYPAQGKGSNSYTWNNQTLSMNFANTTFDWANMLNSYPSSSSGTSAQRTAIATLMKACGYAVNMEYGIDSDGGSGAMSFDIAPALVDNFQYDNATHTEFRDYYSTDEWEEMMYDNLKNVGPIVYCGVANGGGHCFVCDGYKTDGTFHINWGWSGSYDGYFKLNALNPEGQGAGGFAGGYNTQQDATLGIRKPVSGSVKPESYMAIYGTFKATASSRNLTFSATNGGFYNMSSYAASFTVALALKDSNGNVQYVGSKSLGTVQPGYGTGSIALSIPSSVAAGTYKASLVYKVSGDWKPFKVTYGDNNYANITLTSSKATVNSYGFEAADGSTGGSSSGSGSETETGSFSVTGYTTSTGFTVGETAQVSATVKSTYSSAQSLTLSGYLCTYADNQYSVAAQLGSATVSVKANSTATASMSATLSSSLSAGSYYICFADADGYILNTPEQVTVKAASSGTDTGKISVTSMTPSAFTIGETATVKAVFSNTYTSQKTITAKVVLCTQSSSSYSIKATLQSQSVTIAKSATKTVTFSGTVPSDLEAGTYYLIVADSDNNMLSSVQAVTVSKATTPAEETGEVTVTSVSASGDLVVGEAATVKAVFKSTWPTQVQTETYRAILASKSTSGYTVKATLATKEIAVPANTSTTVSFNGTVSSSLAAGTYYLLIANSANKVVGTPVQVTVLEAGSGEEEEQTVVVTKATVTKGFTQGLAYTVAVTAKSTYSTSQSLKLVGYLCSLSNNSYSIEEQLGSVSVTVSANSTKTANISGTLSSDIEAGSYYLVICDENNTILNTPAQVTVEAKQETTTTTSSTANLAISSVSTSTGFTASSDCKLSVEFTNQGSTAVDAKVTPTIYKKSWFSYSKKCALNQSSVKVSANGTATVAFSGTLSALSAGTYYLRFIDESGAIVGSKTYSLTVSAASSRSYTARNFSMASPNAVDPDNASLAVDVEALDEDVAPQFVAIITPLGNEDNTTTIAAFSSKVIPSGQTERLNFFGMLDNLVEGAEYQASLYTLDANNIYSGLDYVDAIRFKAGSTTGVHDIIVNEEETVGNTDADAVYYDLKGARVDNSNIAPGIYIKRTPAAITKVLVK